jgi:hypothetical protein
MKTESVAKVESVNGTRYFLPLAGRFRTRKQANIAATRLARYGLTVEVSNGLSSLKFFETAF